MASLGHCASHAGAAHLGHSARVIWELVTECLFTKSGFVEEHFPYSGCVDASVRKAPMTHWLLNSPPDAQTQDRELPELTRWLFCGQGVHAERGECPTSAVRTGVALRGASRGLVTACSFAKTNDGALFDLSGTRRTEVTTSDVEEGLRLLVFVVERDVTTAATILKAAPWAAAPAPTPIPSHDQAALPTPATPPTSAAPSAPTAVRDAESDPTQPPSAPAHPTPVAQQAGPGSSSLPLPSTGPPHPQTSAPSPSDQATTNTPEEEHQDHTGAPLNHNRPRSSEDFVIFYPGAARRWTRGPSPSLRAEAESAMQTATRKAMWAKSTAERLGIRVEARRRRHTPGTPTGDTDRPATGRGGPFELYFPDGAPDGLTPAPTAVRTSREGQAWAVFSSLEDATAARAGASTRVACQPHGGRGAPPRAGGVAAGGGGHTRGATAIRAENTETDDEAGTDEAETGPRGATQRRRRARGDPAAEAPRGSH
ncbi:hypothetical protein PAPYR_11527 [Paratrimastix pyriformis]|uniref:Uncharacterized protein n=1 Tax=Paratrimastix pyriformis TaxID=342808 RepID=A0ABQ8U957_9EUKA|nr:hypothetical protein PAPYR_11527 [Paratrimastix pyriformis]